MRLGRIAAVTVASITVLSGCNKDSAFPDRPILLICPWSAGGGTDQVARQVAALLEADLHIPVNVINATGGAGVTGHTRGALARPDGYTLTMVTVELNILHWRGLTNISPKNFDPLIMLNRDDAALFVRSNSEWQSLRQLEHAIRGRPRTLKASGTAQGGIWHVALAGWLDSLRLPADDVTWISINGAAPSLQELLSGGVEMVCCSLPEAQTLLRAGEIRCLGVMSHNRTATFPDVPTFREQGNDWSIGGWRGLALPRGVPPERIQALYDGLNRIVNGTSYQRFMESSGFNISIEGREDFGRSLESYDKGFREILTRDTFQSVRTSRYGPYVFPIALAMGAAAVFLAMCIRRDLRASEAAFPLHRRGMARIAIAFFAVLGFSLVTEEIGYLLASVLLLIILMTCLRVRLPVATAVSLALALLSYQVFAIGLRVPLPRGWLGW